MFFDDLVDPDPLCCCEYFDRNNERNHMLACCCNCIDFDEAFDRFIRCRTVTSQQTANMLLTFQDRLRIPWRGGAKQISLDTIIPIILLPILLAIAAINLYCSIVIFLTLPIFLGYTYYYLMKIIPKTKFFFLWTMWSIIYLWILFQSTVPLLELLPEENLAFIILMCGALFCFFKVKQKAPLSYVVQSTTNEDNLPDITEEQTSLLISDQDDSDGSESQPNICEICRKYVPPRTYHCIICQACIIKRDHHNVWLDCCIGESNHKFFLIGSLLCLMGMLLSANLSLTSICHPFIVANFFGIYILLPDDCSEVYDQYDISICFVGAIYNLLIAICLLINLSHQIYLISKGQTGSEWRRDNINRRSCLSNWKAFLCCRN